VPIALIGLDDDGLGQFRNTRHFVYCRGGRPGRNRKRGTGVGTSKSMTGAGRLDYGKDLRDGRSEREAHQGPDKTGRGVAVGVPLDLFTLTAAVLLCLPHRRLGTRGKAQGRANRRDGSRGCGDGRDWPQLRRQ
jgi:hypothetical protein